MAHKVLGTYPRQNLHPAGCSDLVHWESPRTNLKLRSLDMDIAYQGMYYCSGCSEGPHGVVRW